MNEGLWDFSVRFYAQPGVADRCLALQDRHGIDVPLMLGVIWSGLVVGRRLQPSDLLRLGDAVEPWHVSVVRRLREVRRSLSEARVVEGVEGAAAFRQSIKTLELESERLEIEQLQRLIATGGSRLEQPDGQLALHNLVVLLRTQARPPVREDAPLLAEWIEPINAWRPGPGSGAPE